MHNARSSTHFLTQDSELNINFRALEDFYGYLKMFGDEDRLSKYPEEVVFKSNPKIRKKERIPKNFRGGLLLNRKPLPKSNISEETLKYQVNMLKQVEFLLKNKALLLSKELALKDIDINAEVKSIMYSYYNPVGPYGNDTVIYNGDLVSKNKIVVHRRVNLIKDKAPIGNLMDFDTKVGFFNFNTAEDEEWEYSFPIYLLVVVGLLDSSILLILFLFWVLFFIR